MNHLEPRRASERSAQHDVQRSDPEMLERAAERGAERAVEEYRSVSVERSGMLPDPDELARYEHHFPGLGNEIVGWTRDEIGHRRDLERRAVNASIRLAARGQGLAFGWALLSLLAAVILALDNKDAGAISALAAALVPVLFAFVGSRWRSSGDDG